MLRLSLEVENHRTNSGRSGEREGKRHSSVMSAGCCGTKKLKTDSSCNGASNDAESSSNTLPSPKATSLNGYHKKDCVIHPEMCFYCFDVLYSHLNSTSPPKSPRFTNDE